jgi:hypothetical protein
VVFDLGFWFIFTHRWRWFLLIHCIWFRHLEEEKRTSLKKSKQTNKQEEREKRKWKEKTKDNERRENKQYTRGGRANKANESEQSERELRISWESIFKRSYQTPK